jgi:mono/diheme cytochrome c family protein
MLVRLIGAVLLIGCGGAVSGAQVFEQPLEGGNTFACATCHALSEPDPVRRAAHPLAGAAKRPSWKNGRVTRFIDAVNSCVTEWQGASPFTADDPRYVALLAHLEGERSEALTFEIVAPPAQLGGGDARRGEALFETSCALCHGAGGRGSERGPNLAGTHPTAEYVARRIRTSGSASSAVYPGLTGGRMPFWAKDRLSDPELLDLVAFVVDAAVPDGGLYVPDAGTVGGGSCAKTHPKIGWYADLATYAHGVKGRATMTDDCTITLSGFFYDGNGIDVRLYGAQGFRFASGFQVGAPLYRPGQPYVDVTMPMALPSGKTLDDLDSVSVWCVAAHHDFGSGMFRAP